MEKRVSNQAQRRANLFRFETLEVRSLLAGDTAAAWQNPTLAGDVNGDGLVSSMDVLLIVNELNATGGRELPSLSPMSAAANMAPMSAAVSEDSPASGPDGYVDVNGDGFVSPMDLLMVVNQLNAGPPLVKVRLEVQDLSGQTITSIPQGEYFQIVALVDDLRLESGATDPDFARGVAAAFLDVNYDSSLVFVDTNEPFFRQIYSAQTLTGALATPGLLDEVGGVNPTTTLTGPNELLLFSIVARANTQGQFTLLASQADNTPTRDTIIYTSPTGTPAVVPTDQIIYENSPQITIGPAVLPLPIVNVNTNRMVTEVNTGTNNVVFTVNLEDLNQDVTVVFSTADVTAVAGEDYNATSGTLTFGPGDTQRTITVQVRGDTVGEANETFELRLTNPRNATLSPTANVGVATIIDNDGGVGPSLSIAPVSVTEGNSGTTTAVFNVTMSATSASTVTAVFNTGDPSSGTNFATAGVDYNATSGTITFAPGETSKSVTVVVVGDTNLESDEIFQVTLSSPTGGASLGTASALGTITNDDSGPSISIGDVAVSEGNSGTANAVFNLTLSQVSASTVTATFSTGGGNATAGVDYNSATGTVTFLPGSTSASITVGVLGDVLDEANETFNVTLANPSNAAISDGTGQGTITDDDPTPSLSINDVTLAEGNSSTTNFVFTVTLGAASGQQVTVAYTTAAGTGNAATAGTDFVAQSGTLTFGAGATTQTITIAVNGDVAFEPDENFNVNLSNPVNATIADATGVGTITNDDQPGLSINDASVTEGNSGTTNAVFTVTLSAASTQTVNVAFATANGTTNPATAGSDYTAVSGTLTFAPGETTKLITVVVTGDTTVEPNETFTVNLSGATNATITDNSGLGTINNDDSPGLSINDVVVTEGNSGTTTAVFTVTLSPSSTSQVTVQFTTATPGSGTPATAGSDYVARSGTLTFGAGVTTQTITVVVNGDTAVEPNEDFAVNLTNAVGATLTDSTGIGTITNDDSPALSINDVTVTEGNSGTTNAVFNVTLSAASSQTVTVVYTTATPGSGNTATAGTDYNVTSGTLTFNPGTLSQSVTVQVLGDTVVELNEIFDVNLSGATNATISDASGRGTINNDDQPSISINDVSVLEGNSGTQNAVFTISLNGPSTQQVTVVFATANGGSNPATAGTDYNATSGTVTFTAGATSRTITVGVRGDVTQESNETFLVNLSGATNATIADNQGVGTIQDDELPSFTINDVTVTEGNSGTVNAVFTVTLSQAATSTQTVSFATSTPSSGPLATAGADYIAASGTLTFGAGTTTQTITIQVLGDTLDEANETFNVTLSGASSGTVITDATGVGTITDDDAPPTIAINDVTVTEVDPGATVSAVFTVSLSTASGQQVTVNFATANDTATSARDYTVTSGTVTFAPGETTKTITVAVRGDNSDEVDEQFFVNLTTPTNATIADAQGAATIIDDDLPGEVDYSTIEGYVYNDINNDGVKQSTELPIEGATIQIVDAATNGAALSLTTTTDANGRYFFDELEPDSYYLIQTQPGFYNDGVDSVGSEGGSVASNDKILVNLDEGLDAVSYNFGERGVRAEFFSKRMYLNTSTANFTAQNLAPASGALWFSLDGGFDGKMTADAVGSNGTARLTLYDNNLNQVATANGSSAHLEYNGVRGAAYFLALSGTSTDVDMNVSTPDLAWIASSVQESAAAAQAPASSTSSAPAAPASSQAASTDAAFSDSSSEDWLADDSTAESLAGSSSSSSSTHAEIDAALEEELV